MIPTLKGKDTSVAMLQDTHLSSNAATKLRCLWASAKVSSHALPLGLRRNTHAHTDVPRKPVGSFPCRASARSGEGLCSLWRCP